MMNALKKTVIGGLVALAAATTFAQTPEFDPNKAPAPYTPNQGWVLGKILGNGRGFVSEKYAMPRVVYPGDVLANAINQKDGTPQGDYEERGELVYIGNGPGETKMQGYLALRCEMFAKEVTGILSNRTLGMANSQSAMLIPIHEGTNTFSIGCGAGVAAFPSRTIEVRVLRLGLPGFAEIETKFVDKR